MTTRDRIVVMVVVLLVLLAGGWIEVVSPERKEANKLSAEVSSAKSELETAEGTVTQARAAQSKYAAAYSTMVSLGKAVPTTPEVPALIDQLSAASDQKDVDFQSISSGGSSGSTGSVVTPSSGSSGSFSELPFTFTFEGSYFNLEHLFHALTSFATLESRGNIEVSGRLLTIQSVRLSPASSSSSGAATQKLSGSITATAYTLPAGQALSAPAGAPSPAGSTPSTTSTTSSSPTTPAVVKVNP